MTWFPSPTPGVMGLNPSQAYQLPVTSVCVKLQLGVALELAPITARAIAGWGHH